MSDSFPPLAVNANRLRAAQGLVLLFHATGLVGLLYSHDPDFYLRFTPLTLLLSAALLVAFQPERNAAFWQFCLAVGLLGYTAEVVGVHTGALFGHYAYGDTLGPKWLDVPPLIALSWVTTTYLAGVLARRLPLGELARTLVAAVLMVGFDLCLELPAGRYDFWHWTGGVIPFRNFRDWFILACLAQLLFNRARFAKTNALVPFLYAVQLLFFFVLEWLGK